jgi:hypothetical protein
MKSYITYEELALDLDLHLESKEKILEYAGMPCKGG